MRRKELISHVSRVITDLEASGLKEFFSNEKAREEKLNFYQVFAKYMIVSSSYGDIEKHILHILGLSYLLDTNVWPRFQEGSAPDFVAAQIESAIDFVPKIIDLLKQDYVTEIGLSSDELPNEVRGKSIITILLPEENSEFSNVSRIIFSLNSVSDFYEVHCEINDEQSEGLIFLACDSGSDKSFDLVGLAKSITSLKETIIFIWDRIVLHRHIQASSAIETIAKSLPVFSEIAELEKSKKIQPELAEQLRRKVLGACRKFIESGVVIPEMDDESHHSPRLLMQPSRRLLAAPKNIAESNVSDDSDELPAEDSIDSNEDVASELAELKRRIVAAEKKSKGNNSKKKP